MWFNAFRRHKPFKHLANFIWRRDQFRWNCILYVACDFFHYTTCPASYFLWVISFFTCTRIALTTQFTHTGLIHTSPGNLVPRTFPVPGKVLGNEVVRRGNLKTAFSLWNGHQMFSVYSARKKFKSATISCDFGLVFEEKSVSEISWLSLRLRFSFFFFMFSFHTKAKNRLSQIPPVWKAFPKSSVFVTD